MDRFKYGTHRFKEKECVGAEERLKNHLAKLESPLEQSPWLVGNSFSLADINVFPFVRQLFRIQPSPKLLETFPSLKEWQDRISNRPSVVHTLRK
ncbi:MAG: glutathione S-transferase family protein [Deltaproteobacteria bacterium]